MQGHVYKRGKGSTYVADAGFVRIRQTLTTVNDQLVFDTTKTGKSRRRISLDESTVGALRRHRARQVENRLLVGEGWDDSNDLVLTAARFTPIGGRVRSSVT